MYDKNKRASIIINDFILKTSMKIKLAQDNAEAAFNRSSLHPSNYDLEKRIEGKWKREVEANQLVESCLKEIDSFLNSIK